MHIARVRARPPKRAMCLSACGRSTRAETENARTIGDHRRRRPDEPSQAKQTKPSHAPEQTEPCINIRLPCINMHCINMHTRCINIHALWVKASTRIMYAPPEAIHPDLPRKSPETMPPRIAEMASNNAQDERKRVCQSHTPPQPKNRTEAKFNPFSTIHNSSTSHYDTKLLFCNISTRTHQISSLTHGSVHPINYTTQPLNVR